MTKVKVQAFLIIFCGHFPDAARMYSAAEEEKESRAAWYERQIRGSANIRGGRWLHILSGNLSHQIERHVFPDLPACRYGEIAPEVEAACRKYGVPYTTGSLGKQLRSVARRILRLSLPPSRSSVHSDSSPTSRAEGNAPNGNGSEGRGRLGRTQVSPRAKRESLAAAATG